MSCAYFSKTFMHNHSCMPNFIGSFFLTGGLYFLNSSKVISSGLIHFVLLSFSDPVTPFKYKDMILLTSKTALDTIKTLTPFPKPQLPALTSVANPVMKKHIHFHDKLCSWRCWSILKGWT